MRKLIIGILSVITILSVSTSAAMATDGPVNSQKAELYAVAGGSSDFVLTDQAYKGHIHVVDPMGENNYMMNAVIHGLLPNTECFVWVRDIGGYTGPSLYSDPSQGYYKLLSFTTDSEGKGTFNYRINESDLPGGTYQIQVAINYELSGPIGVGYTVAATEKFLTVTVQ